MAICAGFFVLIYGKWDSFQLINSNHSPFLDFFFKYYTNAGDGFMWVPLGLFCFYYRKKYIVAAVAGVIISTLLAQFLKRVIYPEELRPITYLSVNFPVHVVEGVSMRQLHSFPSGHTTTAFTIALIIAHMVNKKSWSFILPLLALSAGYSRVYLGQHFTTDVLAGMCTGIVSGVLSLLVYITISRKITKKLPNNSDS